MRTCIAILLFVLAPLTAAVPDTARQSAPANRTMALTFDDLPFVAAGQPYFPAAARATAELIDVLRRHRAPAIGFVNVGQLATGRTEGENRVALLQVWMDAGMSLGNHTYSHPDFNTLTIEAFKDEIVRGEATLKRLMSQRGVNRMFFRHPMTHTGDTKAKKDAVDAFLAGRGYRIAPHTIENSDYIFNAVFVRAQAGRDRELARRVQDAYLEMTMEATMFAEGASRALFKRDIPQVLLLHANVLTATSLDTILTRFEARGYRFVSLDDAMTDPAYATPYTTVSSFGPTWFWRWARTLGIKLSPVGDPDVPAWVMDAYKRLTD